MDNIHRSTVFRTIIIIFAAALLTACSSASNRETDTTVATQTPPPLPEVVESPTSTSPPLEPEATDPPLQPTRVSSTGIPEVDRAIAVVLSSDFQARSNLVHYTTAGCTHELGMGGPPKCEPGQSEGTPVNYFPVLGPGEGQLVRPESIESLLDFDADALYAVYRRGDQPVSDQYFPSGAYGLIFTSDEMQGPTTHILVHLDEDGGFVRLDYVAWPLESIIERESGEWLIPPEEAQIEEPPVDSTPTADVAVHSLAGLVYKGDDGTRIIDRAGESRLIIDQQIARLSPDGRYVLFQPVYDPDIWLADLITGDRRNLTESFGRFNGNPQWWPGQPDLIIFGSSEELGPGFGSPTTVQTDGSGYRILDPEAGGPLAFSNDGQMLAYGGFDLGGKIYYQDGSTELFDPVDYGLAVEKIFQPAWSPDDRQLAWKVSGRSDTNDETSGIAVFDLESKTAELFHTYNPVGGGSVPHYLSWSPSGEWLAFVTFNERAEDGRLPSLWISLPDGGEEARLGAAVDPVWSPSGNQLAYNLIDDSQSANVVWIYDTGSGEQRQVLPAGTNVVDWLPPTAELFQHLGPAVQPGSSEMPAPKLASLPSP